MHSGLQSVEIRRFKRIEKVAFDLKGLNVIVGANNSGKSSIIQALHFAISVLQTISLHGGFPGSKNGHSVSLAPNQLVYSPAENVYALGLGGRLFEDAEKAIKIIFVMDSGDRCEIVIKKGRNRNLIVVVDNNDVAKGISNIKQPHSIFSPGLAGIAKTEMYFSDGVLLRTLARGDANLILRNILLRLRPTSSWHDFLDDLHEIFPGVQFEIHFNEETDEFINILIKRNGEIVPLEIAGTGLLQAVQILSYIHRFSPSLIVLDEPDSHLHPNNQRQLCSLLRQIAEDRETQILLTTHSRHVVDAVGSYANFLWVREGAVETVGPDDEIGVLLDIGALDIKERLGDPSTTAVVLTEDENPVGLKCILEASGFALSKTKIIPYYGVTDLKNLRPLVHHINGTNPKAKIILHRDRDFLSHAEVTDWTTNVRKMHVEPFITKGVDTEAEFLNSNHLAQLNPGTNSDEFADLIKQAREESKKALLERYVNGKLEIARKAGTIGTLNYGKLATEAHEAVDQDPLLSHHGKTVLKKLRFKFQEKYNINLIVFKSTTYIQSEDLATIAIKAFGKNVTAA